MRSRGWRLLKHFGRPVEFEEVRAQIGKGGDQLMPVFLSKAFIAERGEAVEQFRSDLFKRRFLSGLRAFPGVRALFERLRGDGIQIVLASSAKGEELKRYEKIAGVDGLVDDSASSDDAEKSKPAPDIFLAALHKANVPAPLALVIGDSPYDAQAASAAGMKSLGVLCGGFAEGELRAAGCATVYQDPEDLLRRIHEWLPG